MANSMRCFPSPRPSPLGRGRSAFRPMKNPATDFVRRVLNKRKRRDCCSLSATGGRGEGQGEVRANPAIGFAGCELENLESSACYSLSQRERVRVRENETNMFIGAAAS
jgi:hypothetical protein